jgi:hypothetical protein
MIVTNRELGVALGSRRAKKLISFFNGLQIGIPDNGGDLDER